MKKIYLTLGLGALFLGANAQQLQKQKNVTKNYNNVFSKLNGGNSIDATTCYTVTTITSNDSLTLYTIPSSTAMPDGGYVSGNNGYGDQSKANFIPAVDIPTGGGNITGVMAIFFQETVTTGSVTSTIGTHGTGSVSVSILNGDTTSGPSGAAIATATASLATITTMTSSTSQVPYLFNLSTPIAAPSSGFFASLNLPTTTGDTAVLFIAKLSTIHNNYAWDQNGGSWLAFSNSSDWGLRCSLTLLPIICQTTGIKNNVLETNVVCFPNPSQGQFNIAAALPKATDLIISITNPLGQCVLSKKENNITNSVLNYDLSSIGKGVYSVSIRDTDNNITTKKIILE